MHTTHSADKQTFEFLTKIPPKKNAGQPICGWHIFHDIWFKIYGSAYPHTGLFASIYSILFL